MNERYLRWLSRCFFAPGYDREDMEQEARIAAWLAPECPGTAARRRLLAIVQAAQREKRRAQMVPLGDVATADVFDLVAVREELRRIVSAPLTDLQREALGRAIRGEPYAHDKRLDNALQGARQKLRAAA